MSTLIERSADILRSSRSESGPLPSIRKIAATLGVTPRTAHAAMRRLQEEGILHFIDRKGAFWGSPPGPGEAARSLESIRPLDLREKLLNDVRQGVFHPHLPLPSRKELAWRYGTSRRKMGSLLENLTTSGIFVRKGRALALPPLPAIPSRSSILLVIRCDEAGRIELETERESEFVRAVRRHSLEHELAIKVAGWHENGSSGTFLDSDGCPCDPFRSANILGCMASTWLLQRPLALLDALRAHGTPVAVWWEQAHELFPRKQDRKAPIAGFDLSFGRSPGIVVGRRLASEGLRRLTWISPYHDNSWSPARLEGLRESFEAAGGRVSEAIDTGWHSLWHMERLAGGREGGRKILDRCVGDLVDRALGHGSEAWVVVGDVVAESVIHRLRALGEPRPRVVSFDGTTVAERLRFDSFEFHTDGMVRRMFHHILRPALHPEATVEEMVGRLVLRA
ncbi:MAG: GntR family transcriptional regulator [Fibrobacteria bacterium]|nr:GntR family transcriptional regulator [Fibrobacteria bacterium]